MLVITIMSTVVYVWCCEKDFVLHENKEQRWMHPLDQACSVFYVLRATSGKIWFACGQREGHYTKLSISYI
jgi:hypothetical protein